MGIRENILALTSAPVEKEVDGKQVFIRRLTLGEADQINNPDASTAKLSSAVRMLARFLGDEKGTPLFDLAKPEDVSALQAIPAVFASKLVEFGNTVNVPAKDAPGELEKKG